MQNNGKALKRPELVQKVIEQFTETTDKNAVSKYLGDLPYYDLIKGYKNSQIKSADNKFIPGITIDVLYQIHWLDLSLNDLLLKYSLETEKHLKSQLIDILSGFGMKPDQYLDKRKYSSKSGVSILSDLQHDIHDDLVNNGTYNQFCEEHGVVDLPAWFFIQHISFGRAIRLYSILKPAQKLNVANSFFPFSANIEKKKNLLKIFLDFSLEIRNKSAHGGRLANIDFTTNINSEHALLLEKNLKLYFKIDENNVIVPDISNFIVITFLLSNIPLFQVNMVNEFILFFETNSADDNNALSKIGMNAYSLFNIDPKDIERIKKMTNDLLINRQ